MGLNCLIAFKLWIVDIQLHLKSRAQADVFHLETVPRKSGYGCGNQSLHQGDLQDVVHNEARNQRIPKDGGHLPPRQRRKTRKPQNCQDRAYNRIGHERRNYTFAGHGRPEQASFTRRQN